MLMSKQCSALVLAMAAMGCGPESHDKADEWMLGTFSTVAVPFSDLNLNAVRHYEFREDGVLVRGGLSDCGEEEITPEEFTWERVGDNVIEVVLPASGSGIDAWRFTVGSDCDVLFDDLRAGQPLGDPSVLYRGAVCLQALGPGCQPGETECNSCESIWCDEPPPECDDSP